MISSESALALLQEQKMEENLLRHSLQSEAVMRALAMRMKADEELWAITGLLHDIDYPQTVTTPEKHGLIAMSLLEGILPEEALYAIKAHNSEYTGYPPRSSFDFALRAGETVTGLINAAALIRPSGFEGMAAKSIKKKMKDKAFAATVNRENIRECEKFGMELDVFLQLSINAVSQVRF